MPMQARSRTINHLMLTSTDLTARAQLLLSRGSRIHTHKLCGCTTAAYTHMCDSSAQTAAVYAAVSHAYVCACRAHTPSVLQRHLRARIRVGQAVQQLAVSLPARAGGLVARLARAPSRLGAACQDQLRSPSRVAGGLVFASASGCPLLSTGQASGLGLCSNTWA